MVRRFPEDSIEREYREFLSQANRSDFLDLDEGVVEELLYSAFLFAKELGLDGFENSSRDPGEVRGFDLTEEQIVLGVYTNRRLPGIKT